MCIAPEGTARALDTSPGRSPQPVGLAGYQNSRALRSSLLSQKLEVVRNLMTVEGIALSELLKYVAKVKSFARYFAKH